MEVDHTDIVAEERDEGFVVGFDLEFAPEDVV